VAERDGEVVQVKARRNDAVNKEWLCDEGRYGFGRFAPENRITAPLKVSGESRQTVALDQVIAALKSNVKTLTVLCSPDLLLEEYYALRQLLLRASSVSRAVIAYRGRKLTPVQEILVSPDYASNFRAAQMVGLVGDQPELEYRDVLAKIRRKEIDHVLVLGDRAIDPQDMDQELCDGLRAAKVTVGVLTDANSPLISSLSFVVPGRSVLEKSGLMLNRQLRLQYAQSVLPIRDGTVPEWRFLGLLAEAAGLKVISGKPGELADRDVTLWYLSTDPIMSTQGLTIHGIKAGGVQLQASGTTGASSQQAQGTQGAPSAA
jgi:NADH-quinone oxidoreductase subunit G